MLVKLYVFCIISSFISGTLACNGCRISDFTLTTCADTTNEILQIKCQSLQFDDACSILTNCSRVVMQPIHKTQFVITGVANGIDYNLEVPDVCASLREGKFEGDTNKLMTFYDFADTCENPMDYSKYEIRSRQFAASLKSQVSKAIKETDFTFKLKNVNGIEGFDACYNIKTKINCVKHHRKPKEH